MIEIKISDFLNFGSHELLIFWSLSKVPWNSSYKELPVYHVIKYWKSEYLRIGEINTSYSISIKMRKIPPRVW